MSSDAMFDRLLPREYSDPTLASTMADLRDLTWAAIEDTLVSGTAKERMDLISKLAPYLFRDAASKESGEDTTLRRLGEMSKIMAGLWGGVCPSCGHSYQDVGVDELDDNED
jgi:hypothetical protein